jgi:PAS domain S-box-containing protein
MESSIMQSSRYKILLVEDDKLDQVAFVRVIEDQDLPYDCELADSVTQAKELIDEKQFDVVVSDYALGDGTALDILESVESAPVILVTGVGDEELAVTAWRSGAYDYVIKDSGRSYLKTITITIENAVRHKRMESKLNLLSHAVVGAEDSVYITDLDNRIIFVNRAFCDTYSYSEEEVIGRDCNMLWKDSAASEAFQANQGWEVGFYHRRKDGSEFPVSLSSSQICDEKGNVFAVCAIARDISERMKVEGELRTINQELKKQNQLKSDLAATISEELVESFNGLKELVNQIRDSVPAKKKTDFIEKLDLMDRDIDRMGRIIKNFRDTFKIETSKAKLSEVNVAI